MNIEQILSDKRSSQAAIGVTAKVFKRLLPYFKEALIQSKKKNPYRGGRRTIKLKSTEEKLFFVLFFIKNYPTYDVLGMNFGISRSDAFKRIALYTKALELSLKNAGHLPAESIEQLNKLLGNEKVIIIDATEQKKNRPKNKEKQKDYYSGKKNSTQ
jgi:hypothetical protein